MTLITKMGFCPACRMTQKVLDAHHIKYTLKHLSSDKAKAQVKDFGFKQYPIVEPNDKLDKQTFSGFRPEKLQQLQ